MNIASLVRNRRVQLGAAGLVALLAAGYGVYLAVRPYDLRRDDPHGWIACAELRTWQDGTSRNERGEVYPLSLVLAVAGDQGRQSEHVAIRAATRRDVAGKWTADPEQLRTACRSIGVNVPNGHW